MAVAQRIKNDLLLPERIGGDKRIETALNQLGIPKTKIKLLMESFPRGMGLREASVPGLLNIGLTEKQAQKVVAAFSVVDACDAACQQRLTQQRLMRPEDVAVVVRRLIGHRNQEVFAALLLDARLRVIDVLAVAMGSLAQVDVHPRELFREAVRRQAHSIILAHNHPSGSSDPGESDIQLTHRMAEVGRLVGIPVLDHLVVTPTDATSLASLGLVPG